MIQGEYAQFVWICHISTQTWILSIHQWNDKLQSSFSRKVLTVLLHSADCHCQNRPIQLSLGRANNPMPSPWQQIFVVAVYGPANAKQNDLCPSTFQIECSTSAPSTHPQVWKALGRCRDMAGEIVEALVMFSDSEGSEIFVFWVFESFFVHLPVFPLWAGYGPWKTLDLRNHAIMQHYNILKCFTATKWLQYLALQIYHVFGIFIFWMHSQSLYHLYIIITFQLTWTPPSRLLLCQGGRIHQGWGRLRLLNLRIAMVDAEQTYQVYHASSPLMSIRIMSCSIQSCWINIMAQLIKLTLLTLPVKLFGTENVSGWRSFSYLIKQSATNSVRCCKSKVENG